MHYYELMGHQNAIAVLTSFAFLLIGGFGSDYVMAQNQPSVNGSAGRLAAENGAAALLNRKMADRLYEQSIKDESAAWSSFPPNVALLSKALQQSKDAKALDDQAKELARSSLHAAQIGTAAANAFSLEMYGAESKETLQELANNSSPLVPKVQETMAGYGVDLDPDKMALKTPFGTFSTNISDSALEKGARMVAGLLGYSADDVSQGIQQAKDLRAKLGKQAEAEMSEKLKKIADISDKLPLETGQDTSTDTDADQSSEAKELADRRSARSRDAGSKSTASAINMGEAGGSDKEAEAKGSAEDPQYERRIAGFQAQLDAIHERFGDATADEPWPKIAAKGENIFNLIRIRYRSLQNKRAFIEDIPQVRAKRSSPARRPASE